MRYKRTRKITHRVSSVTNGFVQAILPDALPDADEHAGYLSLLGINPGRVTCVYCGDPAQHWDHLFPYVRGKRPTGFFNEARNLVPACGPCNTSKSGRDWEGWMFGNAKGSPRARQVANIEELAQRLRAFVARVELTEVDVQAIVPPELWQSYWAKRDLVEQSLFDAQNQAAEIRKIIERVLAAGKAGADAAV